MTVIDFDKRLKGEDLVIDRLEKLERGEVDEVIGEIKANHNVTPQPINTANVKNKFFLAKNEKSIAITSTIALSIIIPSLILGLAPHNIKNIGISVGLCLTGLLTALLITTCYQPNNKLDGVRTQEKNENQIV